MSQKSDERITQDVLDELAWDPAVLGLRSDADIADDIRCALELDYQVPDEWLSVSVIERIATLTGNVDWSYQRNAAYDQLVSPLRVLSWD